jgi:thiamine biosynthesis lipoprotein
VPVAPETLLLLQRSVEAARATDGRFDPTVGASLVAHGYDRTFVDAVAHAREVVPTAVVDASWPAIEIDVEAGTACLPSGTVFDPGGIGKGLAADLVAEELAGQVDGILVNVGGDVRLCGAAGDPGGWVITVEDPFATDEELTRLAIPHGAVATSSKQARRWETAEGPAHHIIDPRTGRPADGDVAAVTVVAATAWWAEAQATSLFLGGRAVFDQADESFQALVVLDDGRQLATPGMQAVLP